MKQLFKIPVLFLFIAPYCVSAQSTYLTEGSKEYNFLDRLAIKNQYNSNLNFSNIKPYSRKSIIEEVNYYDSSGELKSLSKSDQYNLQSLRNNSKEWTVVNNSSDHPTYNTLYKNRQNLIDINNKGFFMVVDPILQLQEGYESLNRHNISLSTFGLNTRGLIAKKIGFAFSVASNTEKGPSFYTSRVFQYNAVPGYGKYSITNSGAFRYTDIRGYLTFGFAKHINVQVGYDKNFIGNGYRSVFLSDYGSSYPFIKINTRIWKFNYENIFAELEPAEQTGITMSSMHKYMAMHHLSMNIGKSLNVGLFESIISARENHFDFEYLNPIIFLRQVEGNVGSPDKAHVGIDIKANAAHSFQFYGQFLLDEFLLHQFVHHTGFWANKWGLQAGMKYIDAFAVKNLDAQLEVNIVRPFTYSHFDPVTNYSTYNQPLADALGANFHEVIGIIKYQPLPKWNIYARLIYFNQGLDSMGVNLGSNIFLDYRTRPRDYGFKIAGGDKINCINAMVNISYELFDNLYFEGTATARRYSHANSPIIITNEVSPTSMFSVGIRWNVFKRDYNY